MRRIAIFVEGQTELIFVREFLLRWFEYQIDVECRTLFTDSKFFPADYDFPCQTAEIHVQVVNVGMDGNVLTRILDREQYFYNADYQLIIGLRDMYSEEYRIVSRDQTVDTELIQRFRKGVADTIQKRAKYAGLIRFCYAIMELETWFIGIDSLWQDIDSITKEKNRNHFKFPESVFHPTEIIKDLSKAQNRTYSKHKHEAESIVGQISRDDFVNLYTSQRCPSFCEFVQHIQSSISQP